MSDMPCGTTHKDTGPSSVQYLKITDNTHDYWCDKLEGWFTFEGGHNVIRGHWKPVSTQ